ncbi:rhodanese-like domain-containing protein [uncultured Psychroserpens sp.]|uniref:rhodanese-like domain-containing protein n=1 Tax=uncultured Psychroserpens sp. TaxID=255436 RepID=UPI002604B07D|nr:rhodanese-like domain-containing protein [uncultured Psychroserpens sp.]
MKTTALFLFMFIMMNSTTDQRPAEFKKAKVSYSDFETLVKKVKKHRKNRLISCAEFVKKSQMDGVVILDTRSKQMYDRKHIKGAIHLNFSDFTQDNLAELIPDENTTILIYCNNNFSGDEINFASKVALPKSKQKQIEKEKKRAITLALNIPTYINLYGYGYQNVYELAELISIYDQRITYEGSTIQQKTVNN